MVAGKDDLRDERSKMSILLGKHIAVLVADGFEQLELTVPVTALSRVGALLSIVSPCTEYVHGWDDRDWGERVPIDTALASANPNEFDALLLPGGLFSADTLRINDQVIAFTREFIERDKPIASICHSLWILINAEGVRGRTLTSHPALRFDLENAGAEWVDRKVVVDGNLVTSRRVEDLNAFNEMMIHVISKC